MNRSSIDIYRAVLVAGVLIGAAHSAAAADVTAYYLRKGLVYQQDSAAAPTADPFSPARAIVRANADPNVVSEITLGGSEVFPNIPLDSLADRFQLVFDGPQADMDTYFPSGDTANYTFTVDSATVLPIITMKSGTPPSAIPQVLNYAAAQNINEAQSFTLNFAPFT